MSAYLLPPAVERVIGGLRSRISALENTRGTPRYTTATRPTASTVEGLIIYVTDGAPGSRFQGSDGTSWVSLG